MLGDYMAIAPTTGPDVPAVPIWVDTRTTNPDPFVTRVGIAAQLDFTSWQAARLSLSQIGNPALGGPSGDADGDGLTNAIEFILNSDPLALSGPERPTLTINGPSVEYVYRQRRDVGNVSSDVETSPDLQTWTSAGPGTLIGPADAATDFYLVTRPLSSAQGFFRLRVVVPESAASAANRVMAPRKR